jgi:hypothetical protein
MQKTGEFVTGPEVYDISGIVRGDEIKQPHLSKYTVFVQSRGSGARHLSANSRLLYEVTMPYPQFLVLLYMGTKVCHYYGLYYYCTLFRLHPLLDRPRNLC